MSKPTISIVPCDNYKRKEVTSSLNQAIDAIDGLDWVQPGMKIAIKTNLVSGSDPKKAVVSHPAVLAVLTETLQKKGATVIIGDSPSGPYTVSALEKNYKLSRMDIPEEMGASLNTNVATSDGSFPDARIMKKFTYTSWLDDADGIIVVCKLKTHGMMRLSANVKNMFGAIPGTMKPEYHYRFPKHEDFANMLVDINEYFKPKLYITDAIIGMEGNGPTAGNPRKIGALLASTNPHALDVVCATLIDIDPDTVPTIHEAYLRGLGPNKLADIPKEEIFGEIEPFIVHDYDNAVIKSTITFSNRIPEFLIPVVTAVLQSKPKVKKSECIGCKKCAKVCPAHAIVMKNGKPVIDRNVCIRCFCCQEFCPKGAMKVHRNSIVKMLQH